MSETKTAMLKEVVAKELAFMKLPISEAIHFSSLYRHGVQQRLGENPELYGRLLMRLPKELHHEKAERAAYAALTLAAFVGNDGEISMAKAIHTLENANIVKRFRRAEMAYDMDELVYHMRGVLKLIASSGQKVNYADLAADLYRWQYSKADQIRAWERNLV